MNIKPPSTPSEVRYELKIPCDATMLAQARSWIRLHPEGFRTSYPTRQVNNLYLDSPGMTNLAENLAGQAERRKLRYRWYDRFPEPPVVKAVLELKIKHGSVGDKKRLPLQTPLALDQPFKQIQADLRAEVPDDWLPWVLKANRPALINHYRRDYFVSPDSIVRCTLDYEQTFYDQRFQLRPNLTNVLVANDMVVIEIKAPVELEERLERAMHSFPISRHRHSKYVDGLLSGTF